MPLFFRCSLCGDYMSDPVIVCTKDPPTPLLEGISYERSALQDWIEVSGCNIEFVSNAVLKRVIDDWRLSRD